MRQTAHLQSGRRVRLGLWQPSRGWRQPPDLQLPRQQPGRQHRRQARAISCLLLRRLRRGFRAPPATKQLQQRLAGFIRRGLVDVDQPLGRSRSGRQQWHGARGAVAGVAGERADTGAVPAAMLPEPRDAAGLHQLALDLRHPPCRNDEVRLEHAPAHPSGRGRCGTGVAV